MIGTNSKKGFTLIEVVFVLAIFLIIMGVTISIFLSMIRQQKRILAEQELLNQTSYAFEYMSKALRSAVADQDGSCLGVPDQIFALTHCNNGALEACQGVKFINQSDSNSCQEFFLDEQNPLGPVFLEVKNGAPSRSLLSSDFTLPYAKFVINGDQTLRGASLGDGIQPRVTVLLEAQTTQSGETQTKIIQTTVSLRNLNIP